MAHRHDPPTGTPSRPAAPGTNWPGLGILAGLLWALWAFAGPYYFVMVMAFVVMIFLHELGHYVTAKRSGMKVTEFYLFFGPEIFSFQRGETRYGIKTIPAGAYVRIIGMNNLDHVDDPADEPRTYRSQSYPKKMLVITAGSAMHFAQAAVLLLLFFSLYGQRDEAEWSIARISGFDGTASPAQQAGLALGDRVVAVDGNPVRTFAELREHVAARPGEEVLLTVERDGSVFEATTTLAEVEVERGEPVGFLGVGPRFGWDPLPPGRAVVETARTMGEQMWLTVTLVPQLFTPGNLAELGSTVLEGGGAVSVLDEEAQTRPIGVVGAVRITAQAAEYDWAGALIMFAGINVFIGVFNLFPLLPLDGGHAAVATYERIRSRNGRRHQIDVAKLMPITYAVVGLLGFVFLTTLWLDIFRPISF
jgi:membrane-associated protease RseP (regulator of RpoE activity)